MNEEKMRATRAILASAEKRVRNEVGEQIRRARVERDMSQAELADLLNRRQAYISDIENGKTEPNVTFLVQLSMVLDKPIQFFFPSEWPSGGQHTLKDDELTPEESELIHRLRQLEEGFSYHLALRILLTMAEVNREQEDYFNRNS